MRRRDIPTGSRTRHGWLSPAEVFQGSTDFTIMNHVNDPIMAQVNAPRFVAGAPCWTQRFVMLSETAGMAQAKRQNLGRKKLN